MKFFMNSLVTNPLVLPNGSPSIKFSRCANLLLGNGLVMLLMADMSLMLDRRCGWYPVEFEQLGHVVNCIGSISIDPPCNFNLHQRLSFILDFEKPAVNAVEVLHSTHVICCIWCFRGFGEVELNYLVFAHLVSSLNLLPRLVSKPALRLVNCSDC